MLHILSKRYSSGVTQKGILYDLPYYCTCGNKSNKCSSFYLKVFASFETGFYTCPFGYAIYYIKKKNLAYIGLRVSGVNRKGKHVGEGIYLPSISKERLLSVIDYEMSMLSIENECERMRGFKDELQHGMEKILGTCRAKSESLLAALDEDGTSLNPQSLRQDLKTILIGNIQLRNLFYATRIRFDSSLSYKSFPTVVYNKFYKAKKLLHKYWGRDVHIELNGASFSKYNLTASFELLPYLLLENASKFSLAGASVEVSFSEHERQLDVVISNIGPLTRKSQEQLCSDHERGEYSAEAQVEGSGIGLFTCQEIARINQLGFTILSDSANISYVDAIPYAPFIVHVIFPQDLFVAAE